MTRTRSLLIAALGMGLFVGGTVARAVLSDDGEETTNHAFRPAVVAGAVLRPASATAPTFDPDACETCGVIDDDTVWEVDGHTARVLARDVDRWRSVLVASDSDASRFGSVRARTEDLTADGTPEVVFGFRGVGTGGILQVDVVAAPGDVVLHRDLDKGDAAVRDGKLETWEAQFLAEDPNCCPSAFLYTAFEYRDDRWQVADRRTVPADAPRRGQL
jgi:hypothetical protein